MAIPPFIKESMWKVNQKQKFNILFPSLAIRLATTVGVEKRRADIIFWIPSGQRFLSFGKWVESAKWGTKRRKLVPPSSLAPPPSSLAPAPPY
ncbi:hypothetical protein AHAS_Ahas20G0186500 [Arachis hypogaea]